MPATTRPQRPERLRPGLSFSRTRNFQPSFPPWQSIIMWKWFTPTRRPSPFASTSNETVRRAWTTISYCSTASAKSTSSARTTALSSNCHEKKSIVAPLPCPFVGRKGAARQPPVSRHDDVRSLAAAEQDDASLHNQLHLQRPGGLQGVCERQAAEHFRHRPAVDWLLSHVDDHACRQYHLCGMRAEAGFPLQRKNPGREGEAAGLRQCRVVGAGRQRLHQRRCQQRGW